MGAHNVLYEIGTAGNEWKVADPGDTGAIPVVGRWGICHLETGGAETRTMGPPTAVGQRILLVFKTDGGDCVVTVASTINAAGNTIITFDDEQECLELVGMQVADDTFRWCTVGGDAGVS